MSNLKAVDLLEKKNEKKSVCEISINMYTVTPLYKTFKILINLKK